VGVVVIYVLAFTVFSYCFIHVYLFLFVTSVRTAATERKIITVNNNNNNNKHNTSFMASAPRIAACEKLNAHRVHQCKN